MMTSEELAFKGITIEWSQDPLSSKVTLDERAQELFKLKIRYDELDEHFGHAMYHVEKEKHDPEKLQKIVDSYEPHLYEEDDEKNPIAKRTQLLFNYYLDTLTRRHAGDCTCLPAGCSKCSAERLLGINTIEDLGKHSASYIQGLVVDEESPPDIKSMIAYLEDYEPKAEWSGWEKHADRWRSEARHAAEWLKIYKEKHFPDL